MGVDELHSHRTFADCRGAAFGRPERTSPAANTPGISVSSRLSVFAVAPVRMKPSRSRPMVSLSHPVHGSAPRKRNRNEKAGARRS